MHIAGLIHYSELRTLNITKFIFAISATFMTCFLEKQENKNGLTSLVQCSSDFLQLVT